MMLDNPVDKYIQYLAYGVRYSSRLVCLYSLISKLYKSYVLQKLSNSKPFEESVK